MEKKTAAKKTTAKKTETTKATATRETKAVKAHAHGDETAAPKAAKAKKSTPKAKGHAHGKSCKVGGCKRTYRAKGYCKPHYRMWRHGKFAKARYTKCHDYGCTKAMGQNRHGYCEEHFTNYYVKGMEVTHAPVAAPAKKVEKAEETAA